MRPATPDEIINWDELIVQNPSGGDVFQGKVFATAKQEQGWQPQYMVYVLGDQRIYTLYLNRKIPLIGELWYGPKGPGITTRAELDAVLKANREFAQGKKIFAFKIDPEIPKSLGYPAELVKVHDIQPNAHTAIVDLKPTEDEIMATFRQRARRSIRQAKAAGVQIKAVSGNQQNYKIMYDMYYATGKRAGFHVRDISYHQRLWHLWSQAGQGQLFFAYSGDQVIAAAFVAYIGQKGLYKDGSSDREALNNGAAHLLQWEIMRWLKARSVTSYDLHGTPPAEELENTQHRFYGLGLFKTSFANELTEFIGTVDQVINSTAYKRWRKLGDRLAQSLEYRLRGRTFY